MSVDVLVNNGSIDRPFGLGTRVQAPFTGYFFAAAKIPDGFPGPMVANLVRIDGPGPITTHSGTFFDLPDDSGLHVVLQGDGNQLTGEIFSRSDLTIPIVSLSATDSTYASGYGEIFAASGTNVMGEPNISSFADETFDGFSLLATQVPEPASCALALIFDALVAARGARAASMMCR